MLVIEDVTAGYDDFTALFNASIEVKAGEAVAVIGPNGAGKSTLMRAISGHDPAQRRLDHDGRPIDQLDLLRTRLWRRASPTCRRTGACSRG